MWLVIPPILLVLWLLWQYRNEPDPAYFDVEDLFKKEDT